MGEDVCDVCGELLGDDVYHIEDIVGHLNCLHRAVSKGIEEIRR